MSNISGTILSDSSIAALNTAINYSRLTILKRNYTVFLIFRQKIHLMSMHKYKQDPIAVCRNLFSSLYM